MRSIRQIATELVHLDHPQLAHDTAKHKRDIDTLAIWVLRELEEGQSYSEEPEAAPAKEEAPPADNSDGETGFEVL